MMRTVVLVVCSLALAAHAGCSPGDPSVSGFGLGNNRVVSVGETVELRIPIDEQGTRTWRVSSYDSLYLTLSSQPRVVREDDGSYAVRFTARAKTPGETTVVLTEVTPGIEAPRTKSFTFRILR